MKIINQAPSSRWLRKPVNCGLYRSWLLERESLTRRLQRASRTFKVQTSRLTASPPLPDEVKVVGLRQGERAAIREVVLCCNQKAVVCAHSVLPYRSLRGSWRGLAYLGNKPLGTALFSDPRVKRTPLSFRKIDSRHALHKQAELYLQKLPSELWARRSVFYLGRAAILVTEMFLPEVLEL